MCFLKLDRKSQKISGIPFFFWALKNKNMGGGSLSHHKHYNWPDLWTRMSISKPSLKIGTANGICWNSLGLFRDYGLNYIFFRNKTFLLFKIESWNFQHLFEKRISWNLTKFQFLQLIQTIFISISSIRCLIELKFLRFHVFFFETDADLGRSL